MWQARLDAVLPLAKEHLALWHFERGLSFSAASQLLFNFFSTSFRFFPRSVGWGQLEVLPDVEHASMAREDATMQYDRIRLSTEALGR